MLKRGRFLTKIKEMQQGCLWEMQKKILQSILKSELDAQICDSEGKQEIITLSRLYFC